MSATLLALDTATEACSVALLHNNELIEQHEIAERQHTQRILPMVDNILAQAGLRLSQVDALVFGRGPGSFTGVRVGTGIVQGLAFGADLPVIPISNLTAMAQAIYETQQAKKVVALMDARMQEVYFSTLIAEKVRWENQEFIQWKTLIEEQVCSPQKALARLQDTLYEDFIVVGTGYAVYSDFHPYSHLKPSQIQLPQARYMLSLAIPLFLQRQYKTAEQIEPIYLRNEVTWHKLPGRQ